MARLHVIDVKSKDPYLRCHMCRSVDCVITLVDYRNILTIRKKKRNKIVINQASIFNAG